jgi:hypothetical protein
MLHRPEDDEQKRSRNARRFLWVIVAAVGALLAIVGYTSLTSPDPEAQADRVSHSH